jgi:DNA-binding transcriptional MocR family regulator
MKSQVVIIEDNFYKYFTTKQVLESQLKLDVAVVAPEASLAALESSKLKKADLVLFRPSGGIQELMEKLRKRNANRRNTTVTLMMIPEMDELIERSVVEQIGKRKTKAA